MTNSLPRIGARVLAAIDASTYTDSVCRYASWAASRLQAPLEFLHVIDRHPERAATFDLSGSLALGEQERMLQDFANADEQRGKLAQQRGRLLLQSARHIAIDYGVTEAETHLRDGGLVETLTEMEAGVRLFVLGKRGEHADFARGHLGGNLERVVRSVHRPLLVISRTFKPVSRVLIAFDGSQTTRKGVEMVSASPLFRGLEMRVVMVGDADAASTAQLQWAVNTLSAAGYSPHAEIVSGEPEKVLAALVQDEAVDLLVMGAYGHSKVRQLIVGSTTTTVLRTCQIPVLLLR